MRAEVAKWGNSLAVRIPGGLARELNIDAGVMLEMRVEGDRLVIRPAQSAFEIGDLLAGITDANLHGETEWGAAEGGEAW